MLRNSDGMKGGPGDPRTFREWWAHFKKWPLTILAVLVALILLSAIVNVLDATFRIF